MVLKTKTAEDLSARADDLKQAYDGLRGQN